jgi:ribosomal protein S25
MTKRIKVSARNGGIKEQDAGSEKSESDVKDQKMVGGKKYDNIQDEIMRRSFIMKNTLGKS